MYSISQALTMFDLTNSLEKMLNIPNITIDNDDEKHLIYVIKRNVFGGSYKNKAVILNIEPYYTQSSDFNYVVDRILQTIIKEFDFKVQVDMWSSLFYNYLVDKYGVGKTLEKYKLLFQLKEN